MISSLVFGVVEAQREAMSRPGRVSARRRRSDAGRSDWRAIRDYVLQQVGALLTPPIRRLEIQVQTVDVDRA